MFLVPWQYYSFLQSSSYPWEFVFYYWSLPSQPPKHFHFLFLPHFLDIFRKAFFLNTANNLSWLTQLFNGPVKRTTLSSVIHRQNPTIHDVVGLAMSLYNRVQTTIPIFWCIAAFVTVISVIVTMMCSYTDRYLLRTAFLGRCLERLAPGQQSSVSQRKSGPASPPLSWLESFWGFKPREASMTGLPFPEQWLHWSGEVISRISATNLVPRAFPLKVGGTGKDPGIGWSRVHLTPEILGVIN